MYWPGPGGNLTETDLSGNINEEYVFFNGERLARIDRPSNAVWYYFSDQVGTADVITNASGAVYERCAYFPYGGVVTCTGSDPNRYKFTGKERDSESGMDNFEARYYGSSFGRFMTPDWAARPTAVPYAVFGDPQSLNLYTYVRNDPVSRADADGHCSADPKVVDTVCNPDGPAQDGIKDQEAADKSNAAQSSVTIFHTETIGTHTNDDGSTTTVTQTTTATFSTERGHEGEFLGATTFSTVSISATCTGCNDEVTSSAATSISQKDAVKAIGTKAFTDAQESAKPSFAAQFGHQLKQDFIQHPLKQVGIVLGGASLPVGAVSLWGGIALGAGGATAAIADDALHPAPYQ